MATYLRQRAPGWFRPVAVLLLLWGLMGCAAFYAHLAYGAELAPEPSAWDRAYHAALPGWFNAVYAAAVGGGVLGAAALLGRSRLAVGLFLLSLAAVIVQFGWVFAATDLVAHKGAAATVPFPALILGVALFQLWLAGHARRRGWIS